jgi:hypothetical protein
MVNEDGGAHTSHAYGLIEIDESDFVSLLLDGYIPTCVTIGYVQVIDDRSM